MSYKKATQILPAKLLKEVQKYAEGEYIYIPKCPENRHAWGAATETRQYLKRRNRQIYRDYLAGSPPGDLSERYFLSLKSIQRIIRQEKQNQ
ncbi:CD3324 family protein [Anaerostipes sp.]|uniref:CD3324 family protein n=1 Tax=Anaerostipes sp. TaxID=1872530 RepID=UPI0025C4AD4D|nr:CD3324 family protein [Anaerostipes sp.]MBS7009509.1 hypothetical protein [Anaerostipes sp.]